MPTYRTRPSSSSSTFPYFSKPHTSSSSSYYKRRPRTRYIQRALDTLKRALRDLYVYIRKHPLKVLVPLLMTLVSSGVLASLVAKFGFRLPDGLAGALAGMGEGGRGYDGIYGSQARGMGGSRGEWETGGILKSAVKVASAFL